MTSASATSAWTSQELDVADDRAVNDAVDAAYRTKYAHYAAYIIKAITSPEAGATTMRLEPR